MHYVNMHNLVMIPHLGCNVWLKYATYFTHIHINFLRINLIFIQALVV